MPNRILVMGGEGFLASHLCERLIADGNRVISARNLFGGSRVNPGALVGRIELVHPAGVLKDGRG